MKPLLECKTRDPYPEIINYIEVWCQSSNGWYEDFLVTMSRDGEEITEILLGFIIQAWENFNGK